MYNYKNIDEMLKQAAAILEKANYTNLNNEILSSLINKEYNSEAAAINDLKNIILKVEFNQNNDEGITFNVVNNMLIVEQDSGNTQFWNNPKEDTTEEVGEHFLYPGIAIDFKFIGKDIISFNSINLTNEYIPINEFTTEVDKGFHSKKEDIRKTPTSYPK